MKNYSKQEWSWILYDVANSAFILIVTATIPVYFRALAQSQGLSETQVSTAMYLVTSLSVLLLALSAPVLGAIADRKGMKKKLFLFFLAIGVLGGLSLAVVTRWQAFILMFFLARIGYAACNVFYDGMLVDVCSDERMDKISAAGYAYGYIGSVIPFIIGLVLIFSADKIGLSTTLATQISFLITVIWWGALSIPLLRNVKQNYYVEREEHPVRQAFSGIFTTIRKIAADQRQRLFIIAYFFYIDGVYTIISQATTFGGEIGLDASAMVLALLVTQFVAFPFALMVPALAKRFGSLKMLRMYIVIYAGVCVFGYFLHEEWQFWLLAVIIGMVQGGVQSLSRSYFGRIIPKDHANEYYGFFDIFGKFADFFGPMLLALSAQLFNQSRYGILMLVLLFAIGYVLLKKIDQLT